MSTYTDHFYEVQRSFQNFGCTRNNFERLYNRYTFTKQDLEEHYFPILYWEGPLPNLLTYCRRDEIERILSTAVNYCLMKLHLDHNPGELIIKFVACSGYRDAPDLDVETDRAELRRTTPLHSIKNYVLYGNNFDRAESIARDLFLIYNDVNYIDESGLSHFHVACACGFDDLVERFLELGQDPNRRVQSTGDLPLHMALQSRLGRSSTTVELLLRRGADANLPNKAGDTFLHVISQPGHGYDFSVEILLKIMDESNKPLQIEARDKWGNTALHNAMFYSDRKMMDWLLRHGASPNSTNEAGETPLHARCTRYPHLNDDGLDKLFFEINDELNRSVQLDVRDKKGRTPLELAVANLKPILVGTLLDRGADVSNFVFPDNDYFSRLYVSSPCDKLQSACQVLACVEHLENKGYELDQGDALLIMKSFSKGQLFEKGVDAEQRLFDDEEFASRAKEITIRTVRSEREGEAESSLYDLIQLPAKEVRDLLIHNKDFPNKIRWLPTRQLEACTAHLVEKVSRRFFLDWAIDPFWVLIHYRLPILCCRRILEKLKNEDLYNICFMGVGPTDNDGKINVIKNVLKRNNERPVRARKAPKRLQIEWQKNNVKRARRMIIHD